MMSSINPSVPTSNGALPSKKKPNDLRSWKKLPRATNFIRRGLKRFPVWNCKLILRVSLTKSLTKTYYQIFHRRIVCWSQCSQSARPSTTCPNCSAASNPTALVPMVPLYPTEPPKVKSGFKSVLTAEDAKISRIAHSELLRKNKKNKILQEHRARTRRGVDDTPMHHEPWA